MTDSASGRAVVIGGSIAGMLTAAALDSRGWTVTIVERDRLLAGANHRRGVPQDPQPHILLQRGVLAIEGLLPGFRQQLITRGAVTFNAGAMPWLSEYGWLDPSIATYTWLSATRPLIESVIRDRLLALCRTQIMDDTAVSGLRRDGDHWIVSAHPEQSSAPTELKADLVVVATGRTHRLDRWLSMPAPAIETVDAHVGYASRLYHQRQPLPVRTGIVIFRNRAGVAYPVEGDRWLVAAAGFGAERPPREPEGFNEFLADLVDPALRDLTSVLEPASEISIYRQTANVRSRWDLAELPPAIVLVGDACCALNPVYGQGMTIAALQAEVIARSTVKDLLAGKAVRRRLFAATNTAWAISTMNDLRQPTSDGQLTPLQQRSWAWTEQVMRRAAAGSTSATKTISAVNHLMVPPTALFKPSLLLAACRPLRPIQLPRPQTLVELSELYESSRAAAVNDPD